jgi:hypothetical protein
LTLYEKFAHLGHNFRIFTGIAISLRRIEIQIEQQTVRSIIGVGIIEAGHGGSIL